LIDAVGSVDLIKGCGLTPSHYGKAFGQAVALLDAACVTAELPWLGRLVIFQTPVNDFQGIWAPHRQEIVNAPSTLRWTNNDLDRIREKIPGIGPNRWWATAMKTKDELSERALAVARKDRR
jgi:formate-dependent nitrite reductase cytochrome c552 subunit